MISGNFIGVLMFTRVDNYTVGSVDGESDVWVINAGVGSYMCS